MQQKWKTNSNRFYFLMHNTSSPMLLFSILFAKHCSHIFLMKESVSFLPSFACCQSSCIYAILVILPRKWAGFGVCVSAMGYISISHIYRFFYGKFKLIHPFRLWRLDHGHQCHAHVHCDQIYNAWLCLY